MINTNVVKKMLAREYHVQNTFKCFLKISQAAFSNFINCVSDYFLISSFHSQFKVSQKHTTTKIKENKNDECEEYK